MPGKGEPRGQTLRTGRELPGSAGAALCYLLFLRTGFKPQRTPFLNSVRWIRLFSYFCVCHNISCRNTVNCYGNMKFMAKSSNLRPLPIAGVWCTPLLLLRNVTRSEIVGYAFYYKVSLQVISGTWVYWTSFWLHFGIAVPVIWAHVFVHSCVAVFRLLLRAVMQGRFALSQ